MFEDFLPVLRIITDVFERLHVPYFIGGSVASVVYGVVRMTMDADIIADLREDQVESFVTSLADAFYLDAGSIHDAINRRRCFNVIHLETMFKVDIFIPLWDDYLREEFKRRERVVLSAQSEQTAFVATIEDTILSKLTWYRLGGHVSDRQWRDVIELMKMYQNKLNKDYLDQWAAVLKVSDLLEKALLDSNN